MDEVVNNKDKEILKYVFKYPNLQDWKVLHYPKNEVICYQGDIYPYFYVILNGRTNIYHTSEKGKSYSQSVYKEGHYFGELEIFDLKPYVCQIEALEDTTVMRLERQFFLKWIEEDKELNLYILRSICENFYYLSEKAINDTLYSLKYRVCLYLLESWEKNCKYEVEISKKYLSEKFVVTQRSINRVLKELAEKKLIVNQENTIQILDIKGIQLEIELEKML